MESKEEEPFNLIQLLASDIVIDLKLPWSNSSEVNVSFLKEKLREIILDGLRQALYMKDESYLQPFISHMCNYILPMRNLAKKIANTYHHDDENEIKIILNGLIAMKEMYEPTTDYIDGPRMCMCSIFDASLDTSVPPKRCPNPAEIEGELIVCRDHFHMLLENNGEYLKILAYASSLSNNEYNSGGTPQQRAVRFLNIMKMLYTMKANICKKNKHCIFVGSPPNPPRSSPERCDICNVHKFKICPNPCENSRYGLFCEDHFRQLEIMTFCCCSIEGNKTLTTRYTCNKKNGCGGICFFRKSQENPRSGQTTEMNNNGANLHSNKSTFPAPLEGDMKYSNDNKVENKEDSYSFDALFYATTCEGDPMSDIISSHAARSDGVEESKLDPDRSIHNEVKMDDNVIRTTMFLSDDTPKQRGNRTSSKDWVNDEYIEFSSVGDEFDDYNSNSSEIMDGVLESNLNKEEILRRIEQYAAKRPREDEYDEEMRETKKSRLTRGGESTLKNDEHEIRLTKDSQESLKTDRDFVLSVVKEHGCDIEFADTKLRNDSGIVVAAVNQDGLALQYASETLQGNETIVLEAVKQNGLALQYASGTLQGNETIVLEAVKQNGLALQYASETLQDNERFIVLEAVKQNGRALQYASGTLQADETIVLEAVKQNGRALQYASETLQDNETIVLEAVKQNGRALQYASKGLKSDGDFILKAVDLSSGASRIMAFVSDTIKDDPDDVISLIQTNGLVLEYASVEMKKDVDIVKLAVNQNPTAIRFADLSIEENQKFLLELVKEQPLVIAFINSDYLAAHENIVLEAVKLDGRLLYFASKAQKGNKSIVYEAVNQNGWSLRWASKECRGDANIILCAMKSSYKLFFLASPSLKQDNDFISKAMGLYPEINDYINTHATPLLNVTESNESDVYLQRSLKS